MDSVNQINDSVENSGESKSIDFVRDIVSEDRRTSDGDNQVITRFPPEPNGYMHIGHVKSATLNFGIASETNGTCNLRFDDTNPTKEDIEYTNAFEKDLKWLGLDWGDHKYFSSDYFDKLYEYALILIQKSKAYVCDLNQDEIRNYRGTLTQPGRESPYRDRPIEENIQLFEGMKAGRFEEGSRVLRAKIDMASGNLNMRDPVLYRILKSEHHRTRDKWCIYPTYDFAHGQSDSIEGVTHSICTLEFADHRPLYDWLLEALGIYHPKQIEFARLNLSHTVLSKRNLSRLVSDHHVDGWDDPRMPTVSGMRRRGYTPKALKDFCERIGVAKRDNTVELALLEHCVREDLNKSAKRVMGVLNPLRVVIENYPADQVEELNAVNNPEDPEMGSRKVPFSREIYIERDDFLEDPPKKFFRLTPGREVRLRYGYFITCTDVLKNPDGEIVELRCTYDPDTKGGHAPDGRKVKGTIHWVSVQHAINAQIRIYDNLFIDSKPDPEKDLSDTLNPNSLNVLTGCKVEPSVREATKEDMYQFERQGYFCVDSRDSIPEELVFNRTVSLRDSWGKKKKEM